MSTPSETVSPASADRNVQNADTDVHSVDSSNDSESSSGSTKSGSVTSKSGSVSSSKVVNQSHVVDPNLSVSSEGSQSGSVGSESGSESESGSDEGGTSDPDATFSSAVNSGTTVKLAATVSPVFATPRAAGVVNPKVTSPPMVSTDVKTADGIDSATSPLIVTPAKSLSFDSGATPKVVPVAKSDIPASDSAPKSSSEVALINRPGTHPSTPTSSSRGVEVPQAVRTEAGSGQHNQASVSASVPVKVKKTRSSRKVAKADKAPKQQQPIVVKEELVPPKAQLKLKKQKQQVEEPVVAQHAIVTTVPDPQPDHRKRHKKGKAAEPAKKAKVVEPQSVSTGESACTESSPDLPGPSNRIGKISQGRRFQRLAMSRAKRLGTIADGSIQVGAIPSSELSKALKKVPNAQFNIQPTHAYQDFHKLPGTIFPHVRKIFRDIRSRYSVILEATSELQLSLAIDQERAKAALIKPDADSRFPVLWQFDNDLNRATANPVDREAELNASPQAMVEGIEIDFNDLPNVLATPAEVEVVKDQSAASSSRESSKKEPKTSSTGHREKAKKKHKKHRSQV